MKTRVHPHVNTKKLARGFRNPERPGIISLTPDHSLESYITATEEMYRARAPVSEQPAPCAGFDFPVRRLPELVELELQELPPVG